MSPERTVLLVGGIDAHLKPFTELGVRVVMIQHPDKVTPYQVEAAHVLLKFDYTEWDAVRPFAQAAHEVFGFDTVVSLTEPGLNPAARLNDLFGFGDGRRFEVSRRMRDKALMRAHLQERGFPSVDHARVTDRASLSAFGNRAGYPFIVKPTSTTAGFGLVKAHGPDDLDRVWKRVEELRGARTDRGSTMFTVDGFLMESYVDGPEYSVESFSFAGRHVVIAVTEKLVDETHFAELGHAMPARLEQGAHDEITAAVTGFLTVMGVIDGPAHTEVRVGPDGPVVIESHNRMGGDSIIELIGATYGLDLSALSVGWPLGRAPELPGPPAAAGAACNRFLLREPGTVHAVHGVEEVAARPDVLEVKVTVRPGDVVRPVRDNWDRIGYVMVRAQDTDGAVELCERLASEEIRIDVTGGAGRGA